MINELSNLFDLFPSKTIEIEQCLEKCPFSYPKDCEVDDKRGWGNQPVFPKLHKLTSELGHFPQPDEGIKFLMEICDSTCKNNPRVKRRGEKLYMDFCREYHTFVLMQEAVEFFSEIKYKQESDIRLNIDFYARLQPEISSEEKYIPIQVSMRADWDKDRWTAIKKGRRERRNSSPQQQPEKLYKLSNECREHSKSINGCWLFSPEHIHDLGEQIKDDFSRIGDF